MGKVFSFRYALFLSIILFSIGAYGCKNKYVSPNKDQGPSSIHSVINPIKTDNDIKYENSDNIDKSSLTNPIPLHKDESISVHGTWISLGESEESILNKLGNPNRLYKSELDFDYYVYNNDYSKLLYVAINDNKVVGFYTDSIDFNYLGITSDCSLDDVNQSLATDYKMSYILTHPSDTYTLYVFMDEMETQKVTGIFLLLNDFQENKFTNDLLKDVELMVYDLTNSIRKRNGLPILSWSSTASKAARKHSKDMANNKYFNHYDLYNKNPGDRLKEEGIYYQSIGENIIAGYGTAIISSHARFNSLDHRENILNKDYNNLGVGFTYSEDSVYKSYITQVFYR